MAVRGGCDLRGEIAPEVDGKLISVIFTKFILGHILQKTARLQRQRVFQVHGLNGGGGSFTSTSDLLVYRQESIDKLLRLEGTVIQAALQRQHGPDQALRVNGLERSAVEQRALLGKTHLQLDALEQAQTWKVIVEWQPCFLRQAAKVLQEIE